jgi:hypothetical protein
MLPTGDIGQWLALDSISPPRVHTAFYDSFLLNDPSICEKVYIRRTTFCVLTCVGIYSYLKPFRLPSLCINNAITDMSSSNSDFQIEKGTRAHAGNVHYSDQVDAESLEHPEDEKVVIKTSSNCTSSNANPDDLQKSYGARRYGVSLDWFANPAVPLWRSSSVQ